ncbi:hypothetical protein BACCAP_01163 [Pseudoflavonifractor capillosus ATCC 29799]|uniref:Uncharacterized protein n=1 Tax=Pseudoflavonifractor capillosus ATCC 29799 TaxID=411467 RepID=A6NSI4_9FIRM|nr:hypothetical protein BACCAP_01163 [Pseudoflavonifractor capillosus ATCC 29799]
MIRPRTKAGLKTAAGRKKDGKTGRMTVHSAGLKEGVRPRR